MNAGKQRLLSVLPDLPRWVETRDLLSQEGSSLVETQGQNGFVVWSKEYGVGSVVGFPDPNALARAAGVVAELLAFPENVHHVHSLLPTFAAESATVYSSPVRLPRPSPHPCREIGEEELTALTNLPADLLAELRSVASDETPLVAAFDGSRPVAFAYVASETESLWDVSIDTIESHRRQGYATAAVAHLMRGMREEGKSAVWGALESNRASANLARRLGFVECDRLWVLTRRG